MKRHTQRNIYKGIYTKKHIQKDILKEVYTKQHTQRDIHIKGIYTWKDICMEEIYT